MGQRKEEVDSERRDPLRIIVSGTDPEMESLRLNLLPQLGHDVVDHARTAPELLELCLHHQPDLVIAPTLMDDIETAKVAHSIGKIRSVPFIVYLNAEEKGANLNCDGQIYAQLSRPVRAVQLEVEIPLVIHRFCEVELLRQEIKQLLEKPGDH